MKKHLLLFACILSFDLCVAQTYQWAKNIGGTTSNINKAITVDVSGNIYSTGYFSGTSDFDPGTGTYTLMTSGSMAMYISKLDAAGNFIWAKNIGGSGFAYGHDISIDAGGNIYICGKFDANTDFDPSTATYTLSSLGANDIFISKYDNNGNLVWVKTMGSTLDDAANSIALDASGNVYTTGYYSNAPDFDPGAGTYTLSSLGGTDCFISKLDNNGNFVWAKNIGGICTEEGLSMTIDASGNICTTGHFDCTTDFDPGSATYTLSSLGNNDIFISKLDGNGNFIWAKSMGGTNADISYCIATDNSGNIFNAGYYRGTADFDPGAGTYTLTANALTDIFISKLDAAGNFVWANSMGGSGIDVGEAITVDGSGNVYTVGYFQNIVDFDPGAGIYNMTAGGSDNSFISKLDANGNFVWTRSIGGASNDIWSIALDGSGNFCVSGNFIGTSNFNPPSVANLTSYNSDVFIAKYSTTSFVPENDLKDLYTFYPNPASNYLFINAQNNIENQEIEITNSLGQTVLKLPYSNSIDVSTLPQGFYSLKITDQNRQAYFSKFVKE